MMIPHEQTMRLFVAVELDASIKDRLEALQRSLRSRCPQVRWTRREHLHLTMRFIGATGVSRVDAVAAQVARAAGAVSAFDMEVGGVGCFPPRGRVRIVWVGVEAAEDRLGVLGAGLNDCLVRAGCAAEDKPFHPHVTIGRVREDRTGGGLREVLAQAAWPMRVQAVEELVLIASVLSSRGPKYTVISRHAFGGR